MKKFNPLLCPEFVLAYDILGVSSDDSSEALWKKAQEMTLYLGSYCSERNITPQELASFFNVSYRCSNHQEAAFACAAALVHAYKLAGFGGTSS